jgi:hypothetical protein
MKKPIFTSTKAEASTKIVAKGHQTTADPSKYLPRFKNFHLKFNNPSINKAKFAKVSLLRQQKAYAVNLGTTVNVDIDALIRKCNKNQLPN